MQRMAKPRVCYGGFGCNLVCFREKFSTLLENVPLEKMSTPPEKNVNSASLIIPNLTQKISTRTPKNCQPLPKKCHLYRKNLTPPDSTLSPKYFSSPPKISQLPPPENFSNPPKILQSPPQKNFSTPPQKKFSPPPENFSTPPPKISQPPPENFSTPPRKFLNPPPPPENFSTPPRKFLNPSIISQPPLKISQSHSKKYQPQKYKKIL